MAKAVHTAKYDRRECSGEQKRSVGFAKRKNRDTGAVLQELFAMRRGMPKKGPCHIG